MILQVFSVYDSKARAFFPPFYLGTLEMAARAFADCAEKPDHAFARNPEDYTLYHLGAFDDDVARFALMPQPVNLGLALMFKKKSDFQEFIQPGRVALEGKPDVQQ